MENVIEIKYDDITIADEHLNGHDYDRCKNALWSIYKFIQKVKNDYISESSRAGIIISNLNLIGRFASFKDGGMGSLVCAVTEKVSINGYLKKIKFGSPKVFTGELEKNGFLFSDYVYSNGDKHIKNPSLNDINQFTFSYHGVEFRDVVFGLKFFVDICAKCTSENHAENFFCNGDISIAFKGADVKAKEKEHNNMKKNEKSMGINDMLSEERFNIISNDDKAFIIAFDEAMNGLGYDFGGKTGCASKNEKYLLVYGKTDTKSRPCAARIYIQDNGVIKLRMYLYNVDSHCQYIENAPAYIKEAFIFIGGDCKSCSTFCAPGKEYTIDGHLMRKCNHNVFHFSMPTLERLPDYINLLSKFYPKKKSNPTK